MKSGLASIAWLVVLAVVNDNIPLSSVYGYSLSSITSLKSSVGRLSRKSWSNHPTSIFSPSTSRVWVVEESEDEEINNNNAEMEDSLTQLDETLSIQSSNATELTATTTASSTRTASKREMLKFALPALGIYLAPPTLSNIDNMFVGHTVGTKGLAALSPATICTDQMLYLFSFLSRATTGLVSRGYGSKTEPKDQNAAAAEAGSGPLTVSLICGFVLSFFYAFCTPKLLAVLNVTPTLRKEAASYIYWRGAVTWAALAQAVSLSIMMATRDVITPLKIISLAAIVNVIGDSLLCVWPFQWGVAGAAAATAFATLFSSAFMVRGLKRKGVLPRIRLPTRKEIFALTEFTGPLLGITITRLIGFISMQRAAMRLGVKELAAYQLCINLVIFFLLFAEPLSQLSQTQLPSLIDRENGKQVEANLKSVLVLGILSSLTIASLAGLAVFFGASTFSTDLMVQGLAKQAAPSVFITVATAIFAVTVDGAMLASKDFGFMLTQGISTMLLQIFLLKTWCSSLSAIFATFTLRLGSYAVMALIRIALGYGTLGRALCGGRGIFKGNKINGVAHGKADQTRIPV